MPFYVKVKLTSLPHQGPNIQNFIYLLWFYFVTVFKISCTAKSFFVSP